MDLQPAGMVQPETQARNFMPNLPANQTAILNALVTEHWETDHLSDHLRTTAQGCANDGSESALKATCLLLADIVDQGWTLSPADPGLRLVPPSFEPSDETVHASKERVRRNLQLFRNRQLEEPSVQRFLRDMERPRRFHERTVSILDLVDHGPSLAGELARVSTMPAQQREAELRDVIRPVVQICTENARCEHTGFLLRDIWRYFRHTWSLEYRSTPSRKFMVLVRNAARPMAPVMGIAMISNAPTYLEERDKWIGWRTEDAVDVLRSGGTGAPSLASCLVNALERAIDLIRSDDLVTPEELTFPTPVTTSRLRVVSREAAEKRIRDLQAVQEDGDDPTETRHIPRTPDGDPDWRRASESPLFVRKRASTLASLLAAKHAFQKAGAWENPVRNYQALVRRAEGRSAVGIALGEVRKVALSASLMDVSVCGAVPPYGELLGGKLVALLLGSREVADAYLQRYGHQVSVIASQMKGAPVTRPADLLVLTTTSLYGRGSSQYNRLVLRAVDYPELESDLTWCRLGITKGFGTAHLSKGTVAALRDLSRLVYGARRVNNLFGEGTSPRLRQIREGLEALGVNSDSLLKHANPRISYAAELVPGARRRLFEIASGATHHSKPNTETISGAWLRRWVVNRVTSTEVLGRIGHFTHRQLQEQLQTAGHQLRFDV